MQEGATEKEKQEQARQSSQLAFLQRDYELKVGYLTNHFTRMWTRFNFFVTIESALLGSRFVFAPQLGWQAALLGTLLSLTWYVFGAQDRFLVRIYRHNMRLSGEEVAKRLDLSDYRYVGEEDIASKEVESEGIVSWRSKSISITRLASLFPLLITLVWVVILVLELLPG